jgi:hypothetical protein
LEIIHALPGATKAIRASGKSITIPTSKGARQVFIGDTVIIEGENVRVEEGSEKGMFGDKRLEIPKTNEGCFDLLESYGFNMANGLSDNAERLIELNNEVYDKRNSRSWLYQQYEELRNNEINKLSMERK